MKIIIICGAGIVSGKERQTFATIIQLRAIGHEVFCVMASWGSKEFELMLANANIPFIKLRLGFISKTINFSAIRMTLHQLVYIPSLWWKYMNLLNRYRPDVVLHTNFHHVFLLYPVLGNSKNVFYVHDFFSPSPFYKWLFRLFKKRVHLFIGVSDFIVKSFTSLGIPPEKVALVYNGIKPPVIDYSKAAVDSSSKLKVGIVGQVGEWKGHGMLLKAIAPILKEKRNVELHIIGEGAEKYVSELKYLVKAEGISSQVYFRGRLSSLNEIYGELDIVCVPSLIMESFGLTALEPAFFSIPVICTNMGGLSEIVIHNVTGIVVSPDDLKELEGGLRFLILHPEQRHAMGRAALKRANEFFTIEKSTAKLVAVLT
ncbi:MAG TPA: glycosyltransferase family 4 protein [Cyclobacteriaceae bacterium]|nr:glycosyltransferase family 4 protein [Cyclobacteriaceae bacterium]